jgi:hypothetical protein
MAFVANMSGLNSKPPMQLFDVALRHKWNFLFAFLKYVVKIL